ncbi:MULTISPECIES: rhodanese-like domain-containing protein [Bacillus]|uniref:rhodanese-like domain-containing protein n=1 Tax=Bacillus TaxID=1386 RepID=UPI000BB9BC60|nr:MULTISPECIES: sulfurtransferase [Bacillus]
MLFIILIAMAIIIYVYKRYIPVLKATCIELVRAKLESDYILDIRDYQEATKNPIEGAINIPYGYLQRYYKTIPTKSIHVVADDHLEKNIGIRYLRKKGFKINSYSLANCPCTKRS